jgi:hypothetical protein
MVIHRLVSGIALLLTPLNRFLDRIAGTPTQALKIKSTHRPVFWIAAVLCIALVTTLLGCSRRGLLASSGHDAQQIKTILFFAGEQLDGEVLPQNNCQPPSNATLSCKTTWPIDQSLLDWKQPGNRLKAIRRIETLGFNTTCRRGASRGFPVRCRARTFHLLAAVQPQHLLVPAPCHAAQQITASSGVGLAGTAPQIRSFRQLQKTSFSTPSHRHR